VYRIEAERRVRKAFIRLPRQDRARLAAAIDALSEDPRPEGCRPVKAAGPGAYRVRVGDYRVIYIVLDEERVIVVARVTRRGESTYRRLR
jgi:mRNA interferase RelE/StbE